MTLSPRDIEQFVAQGFVKVEGAFPREMAEACRDVLWREMGLSPERPEGWTQPVVRLGMHAEAPFRAAAHAERLRGALNQLVGAGRWVQPEALGAMVVRFPSPEAPEDDGWHIDASFPPKDKPDSQDYFEWRVNASSRGRAMLMLFLFSDCGEDDAATRVRVGSHLPTTRRLAKLGQDGASLRRLAQEGFDDSGDCDVALATGEAGTVWLLHPFTIHAAQAHRGRRVRFLAQPGLAPKTPLQVERADGGYSPVERAIRLGLGSSFSAF